MLKLKGKALNKLKLKETQNKNGMKLCSSWRKTLKYYLI
jgi:hypothetical protein